MHIRFTRPRWAVGGVGIREALMVALCWPLSEWSVMVGHACACVCLGMLVLWVVWSVVGVPRVVRYTMVVV